MSGTQISQARAPVTVDTGTKYQIAATCTFAGTLPDLSIFVRQVINSADPKDDQFLRVADVTDFVTYGTDRNGADIYRAASFVQNYDDVTTAQGAWNELSARINTLVTSYDTYITAFLTPAEGAVVTYPTVDDSTKTALIAAYETSLTAVTAAETARDTENIACQALQLELETAQASLADAQADVATVTPIVSAAAMLVPSYASIAANISASSVAASGLVTASSASAGEKNGILAQTNNISTQANALTVSNATLESDVRTPLADFLGTLRTRVSSLQAAVTAKTAEMNDCMTEMATLQGAVNQARAQRDADLAAIRAVCPDYVP